MAATKQMSITCCPTTTTKKKQEHHNERDTYNNRSVEYLYMNDNTKGSIIEIYDQARGDVDMNEVSSDALFATHYWWSAQ